MKTKLPDALVRFHIHLRRDHLSKLARLADRIARRKRRDVRLGEALETALIVSLAWDDNDLVDLTPTDKEAPYWLQVGPVDRLKEMALLPLSARVSS